MLASRPSPGSFSVYGLFRRLLPSRDAQVCQSLAMVAVFRAVKDSLELPAGELQAQAAMKHPLRTAALRDAALAPERLAVAYLAARTTHLLLPLAYLAVRPAHADLLFIHSTALSAAIVMTGVPVCNVPSESQPGFGVRSSDGHAQESVSTDTTETAHDGSPALLPKGPIRKDDSSRSHFRM